MNKIRHSLRVLIVLIFQAIAMMINAQVLNIEDPSVPLDSLKKNDLRWGISLSGNVNKQSILVYDAGIVSEIVYHRNDKHQLLVNGRYFKSGTSDGVLINSGFYYMRFTPWFHRRIAPQLFAQQQIDEGRGMLSRTLYGANLRWDATRKEKLSVQYSLGLMYEQEKWNLSGSTDANAGFSQTNRIKVNNVLRLNANIGKHIEVSLVNFLQFPPGSTNFSLRLTTQLNLTFKITTWFSVQVNYQSMYDTRPVIDIPAYYYTTSGGIGIMRE
jgi:hypothetical protein